jgi:hypothetical protein
MRRLVPAVALLLLAGCDGSTPAAEPTRSPPPISAGPASPGAGSVAPAPSAAGSAAAARTSAGWEITVYYTVVEKYHHGAPTRVTGCPKLDCTGGSDDLGTYPADFVADVRTEGTGVTSDGRYLNWSYDIGFWLDTAPRDTDGDPLVPWVSAAADPSVLEPGARFRFADCGREDDDSAVPGPVCDRFRAAMWRIDDEFTPGLGGPKHIDLYLGPETRERFTDSDLYVTLKNVTLSLG